MEALLPVLTARLDGPESLAALVDAALAGKIAFVSLEAGPQDAQRHLVDLLAPDCELVTVACTLAGEPAGDQHPLRLEPVNLEDVPRLVRLAQMLRRKARPGATSQTVAKRRAAAAPTISDVHVPLTSQRAPVVRDNTVNDPLIGCELGNGRYVIESLIGEGGMGRVYRGCQTALAKDVAIKVLRTEVQELPEIAERFHREALAASRLEHQNITRVTDFGEEADGLRYIVMELLVGSDLAMLMETAEPQPLGTVVDLMSQVCAALAVAHDKGVIHRDMKPENVLLVPNTVGDGPAQIVKVCDFGLATMREPDARTGEKRITQSNAVKGTPQYMAPEQCLGEESDARTDLYACGVMLYEMATGALPFEAPSGVGFLTKHVSEQPRPPSSICSVDPRLEAIILKALEKDPAARYQSARELRSDLLGVLESTAAAATAILSMRPRIRERRNEPVAPLTAPEAKFPDFFVALTAAVAQTTWYERGHVEFDKALTRLADTVPVPLKGRGEISFVRRDVHDTVNLFIQTPEGEIFEPGKVLPRGLAEAYEARLTDVFVRRRIVLLSIKEGVSIDELADMVELLAGPDIPTDQLRSDFLSRGLAHVSLLFAEDLLGRKRRLPWQVDLCVSRLARDLRVLPMFHDAGVAKMLELRTLLVGDVVRALTKAEQVHLLLKNADLVMEAVSDIPELAAVDASRLVVVALSRPMAVRVARRIVDELPVEATDGNVETYGCATHLTRIFCDRFVEDRATESDDVLKALHDKSVLAFGELPTDLQHWILAEKQADALDADPRGLLKTLSGIQESKQFGKEMSTVARTLRVLARRGHALHLWYLLSWVIQQVQSPARDPSQRQLATRVLQSLADIESLVPVAHVLVSGEGHAHKPAKNVLVAMGEAGALALCRARRDAKELPKGARVRFVASLRDMKKYAFRAVKATLGELDPNAEHESELLEDLLRACPDVHDDELKQLIARFTRHRSGQIRRASMSAIAAVSGPQSRGLLMRALEDKDAGVRMEAITQLRDLKLVDRKVTDVIEGILESAQESDSTKAVAVGALVGVVEADRQRAIELLEHQLVPRKKSLLGRLADSRPVEDTLIIETVARVLVQIAGQRGRDAVRHRAEHSRGDLAKKLHVIARG